MNNSKPKIAYASVLFGKTPQDTFEVAKHLKNQNSSTQEISHFLNN